MAEKLTPKQQRFVEAYVGNATDAARIAGYAGDDATLGQVGYENMKRPEIVQAIKERRAPVLRAEAKALKPIIATRADREKFWTDMMMDEERSGFERLKASELLGRANADFTDKVEHSGKIGLAELLGGDDGAEKK